MTWRILSYWPLALVVALLIPLAMLWLPFQRTTHDKAANADGLQSLWAYGEQLPLNVVVPADNRWTRFAFVAERADERDGRTMSILILDDHYRGSDPTLRSESGVIGDELSVKLLCSVPPQVARKGVALDPVVARLIDSRCGPVR